MLSDRSHLLAAHPDVVAVRRAAGRRYLTVYLPLSVVAVIFVVISGTLQAWWWRGGVLAGSDAILGLNLLSLTQEWRAEKLLRLQVTIPCAVCGERMRSSSLLDHLHTTHPPLDRLATRALWIMWPGGLVPMGYTLLLTGLGILGFFDESLWNLFPVLAFVPWLAYLVTLAAVLFLNSRYLRPAQRQWQATHPQAPP